MDRMENICTTVFKLAITDTQAQSSLEDICKKYPYFSAAQFFLVKSSTQHTDLYQDSILKAALLFNNNYWLNYQLSFSGVDAQHAVQPLVNDVVTVDETELNEQLTNINDSTIQSSVPITDTFENKPVEMSFSVESAEETVGSIDADNTDSVTEIIDITMAENNVSTILSNELAVSELAKNSAISTPDTVETMLFEPLHTTDYFASVGIKITDEHKPNDKLGLQLKSFTAWLKTMKKVHVVEETTNTATDITIQALADKSNTEAEVVTEAMANILIQQGSIKKAIEVLEKLSLLNPAKSTYFATQINQLNKS
jgi:hypothetical protein